MESALDNDSNVIQVIHNPLMSAKLNGHDPYAYLKDVLARLPTQRASEIAELLPHNWMPLPPFDIRFAGLELE